MFISNRDHKGLDIVGTLDTGELEISGVTPFPMVVRYAVATGICGDEWSGWAILPAGTVIDDFGHDEAVSNAHSFGYMEDEEQDEYNGFSEDNLEYTITWYNPELSGSHINGGDPLKEILADIYKDYENGNWNGNWNALFYIPDLETHDYLLANL